jgi:HAD superfamily hydrolase (TIGR01509 family)
MTILLLDVLDTLVHDPFFVEVPAHFGTSLPELLAAKHPRTWIDFELGHIDEATLAARYFADGRPLDVAALRACMSAAYRFLPGIEPLLAALHERGVAMHVLSNYPVWWSLIEERVGLARYAAWSFVSCRTGLRKPDPAAFEGAARALGVAPEECLLIDDRPDNCDAARRLGMAALRFIDAAQLREALVERGLLP